MAFALEVGEKVKAKRGSQWHLAIVATVMEQNVYMLTWDDGSGFDRVKSGEEIQAQVEARTGAEDEEKTRREAEEAEAMAKAEEEKKVLRGAEETEARAKTEKEKKAGGEGEEAESRAKGEEERKARREGEEAEAIAKG